MPDLTKDIQSLTIFRHPSSEFLKQLKKSKRPAVLTVNGKAAAIVQDAMPPPISVCSAIAARADAEEAIRQGLEDVKIKDERGQREKHWTRYAANMTYLVAFAARAVRDLEILCVGESFAAARWYNGLE